PDIRDRVTFTGELTWDQVPTYLAVGDVFVFPSKFEGMPNALLEAMAAALPVVVSDIPPHRELIQHGRTGFLARDPMEMAHQVTTLANHEDLRHSVGDAARAYVREHLDSEACTGLLGRTDRKAALSGDDGFVGARGVGGQDRDAHREQFGPDEWGCGDRPRILDRAEEHVRGRARRSEYLGGVHHADTRPLE